MSMKIGEQNFYVHAYFLNLLLFKPAHEDIIQNGSTKFYKYSSESCKSKIYLMLFLHRKTWFTVGMLNLEFSPVQVFEYNVKLPS